MGFRIGSKIAAGWGIATSFIELFRRKLGDDLQSWIEEATHQKAPRELRSFAKGILWDASAIASAITLPWSNGQTEGQVNRLKTLKRQMYGRGSFDLLSDIKAARSKLAELIKNAERIKAGAISREDAAITLTPKSTSVCLGTVG